MPDEMAARAASLGLEKFYALDPDGFGKAWKAAEAARQRLYAFSDSSIEPAHIFPVSAASAAKD